MARFSKRIKLGPVRINLSKSGVGLSTGVKGFRVGVNSKGMGYSTLSIPGTGLSKTTYATKRRNVASGVNPQSSPQGLGLLDFERSNSETDKMNQLGCGVVLGYYTARQMPSQAAVRAGRFGIVGAPVWAV